MITLWFRKHFIEYNNEFIVNVAADFEIRLPELLVCFILYSLRNEDKVKFILPEGCENKRQKHELDQLFCFLSWNIRISCADHVVYIAEMFTVLLHAVNLFMVTTLSNISDTPILNYKFTLTFVYYNYV
jgi:hypothetical protein